MKNIIIRTMSQVDLPEILKIEKACKLSHWSLKDYGMELQREDTICLVFEINYNVTGFLLMRTINSNEAELYNIGVLPASQNKGIGTRLLTSAIKQILKQGVHLIWLEVRVSNQQAISFYKQQNFQVVGRRKSFYSQPVEDAYIMNLDLLKDQT